MATARVLDAGGSARGLCAARGMGDVLRAIAIAGLPDGAFALHDGEGPRVLPQGK